MLKFGFDDKDLGFNKVVGDMDRLTRSGLDVGLFEDAVHEPRGTQMALIAVVNEFGSAEAGIPARPVFIKSFLRNERKHANAFKVMIVEAVGRNNSNIKQKLLAIGDGIAKDIKQALRDYDEIPNAPSTVAKKGNRDDPWIDTGQLVEAIEARVVDSGIRITKDKLNRARMRDSRGRFL